MRIDGEKLVVAGVICGCLLFLGLVIWALLPRYETVTVKSYHWMIIEKHQQLRTDQVEESSSKWRAEANGRIFDTYIEYDTYTYTDANGTPQVGTDSETIYMYHPWRTAHGYETNDHKDGPTPKSAGVPLPKDHWEWRKVFDSKYTIVTEKGDRYELYKPQWLEYSDKYPAGSIIELKIAHNGSILSAKLLDSEVVEESEFEAL